MGCGSSKDKKPDTLPQSKPEDKKPEQQQVVASASASVTPAVDPEVEALVSKIFDDVRNVKEARVLLGISAVKGLNKDDYDVYVKYSVGEDEEGQTPISHGANPSFGYVGILDDVDTGEFVVHLEVKDNDKLGLDDILASGDVHMKDLEPFKHNKQWHMFENGVQIELDFCMLPALVVQVVEASELPGDDETDPYCEISLGPYKQATEHETDTLAPVWNETYSFPTDETMPSMGALEIVVRNYEAFGTDKEIGAAMLGLNAVPLYAPTEQTVKLSCGGSVLLRLGYYPISRALRCANLAKEDLVMIDNKRKEALESDKKKAEERAKQRQALEERRKLKMQSREEKQTTGSAVILSAWHYNTDVTAALKCKQIDGKIEIRSAKFEDLFGEAERHILVVVYSVYGKELSQYIVDGADILIPSPDDATRTNDVITSNNLSIICAYQNGVDIKQRVSELVYPAGFFYLNKTRFSRTLRVPTDVNPPYVFVAGRKVNETRLICSGNREGLGPINIGCATPVIAK